MPARSREVHVVCCVQCLEPLTSDSESAQCPNSCDVHLTWVTRSSVTYVYVDAGDGLASS
jgi:hypothetical protein